MNYYLLTIHLLFYSKNIVHRDLAARNILVDSDECVKISDFGLAQMTNANGYYLIQNTRDIPIKWYVPTLNSSSYVLSIRKIFIIFIYFFVGMHRRRCVATDIRSIRTSGHTV